MLFVVDLNLDFYFCIRSQLWLYHLPRISTSTSFDLWCTDLRKEILSFCRPSISYSAYVNLQLFIWVLLPLCLQLSFLNMLFFFSFFLNFSFSSFQFRSYLTWASNLYIPVLKKEKLKVYVSFFLFSFFFIDWFQSFPDKKFHWRFIFSSASQKLTPLTTACWKPTTTIIKN